MAVYTAKVRVRKRAQKNKLTRRLTGNARSTCRGAMRHILMALQFDARTLIKRPDTPGTALIFQGDDSLTNAATELAAYLADQLASTVKKSRNR